MRKRVLLTLVIFAALLVGSYVAFDVADLGPGVTRRNYEAIQNAMMENEVAALLGSEPSESFGKEKDSTQNKWAWEKRWERDDCVIIVSFDLDGRVNGKRWDSPTFFALLCRRLGL